MMQTTGLQRQTIDKYYTSSEIVDRCIKLLKETITIQENDWCIEPSAGNGAFIKSIQSLFNNYKFLDIEPEHDEICKHDYLKYDLSSILNQVTGNIHIIGNPPFGRQSSLAIKFIKKSCQFCKSLSFILPKSFKKTSLQKHFPAMFHLIQEIELPSHSFLVGEKKHDVPCVFQIWIKKDVKRIIPPTEIPKHFTFVKKKEVHDISFRRVGVNAGQIDKNTETKSIQSHYFIKFDSELTEDLFTQLASIHYCCKEYTCGPNSISKQELIKEFNKIL